MKIERGHTDLPMFLVENTLRHGGQYAYTNYYIDLAKHYQLLFLRFYNSNCQYFCRTCQWLDFVHGQTHCYRHCAICRLFSSAAARCLSPFLQQCPLAPAPSLAETYSVAGQDTLSGRHNQSRCRRHSFPQGRQTCPGSIQMARPCAFGFVYSLFAGSQPGGGYFESQTALGRRTDWPADQHAAAAQGWSSHIELALQMLCEIESWLPDRKFICHCDGFYTALIRQKPEHMEIVSHMRKDAVIFDLPEPETKPRRGRRRIRGIILPKPPLLAQTVKQWKTIVVTERKHKRTVLIFSKPVIWYHVSKKPLLMVITRDPGGKRPDDFFVTTNLKMKPEQVIGGFSGRWSIEDTFKNTKQLLGGQQIQCFKRKGPERAAAMSFWLYSTVWLWYLKNKNTRGKLPKLPWYRKKKNPSFADALASLRKQIWRERINCMFDSHIDFEKIPKIIVNALAYAA